MHRATLRLRFNTGDQETSVPMLIISFHYVQLLTTIDLTIP